MKLVFDFENKKVTIYQNDKEGDSRNLKATKLWIGLSLTYLGATVEMIQYKYD